MCGSSVARIRRHFRYAAGFAAAAVAAPGASAQSNPLGDDPAEGWGYLHAQCMQEERAEPSNICEVGPGEEPGLAIIVSSVARFGSKSFDPYSAFERQLQRLHGLEMEPREVMPFASWQEAEASLVEMVRQNREVEDGKVAFLGLSLEPARLTEEPDEEEARAMPPPMPALMAGFAGPRLEFHQTDSSCGLRFPDGEELLPDLVTDPFGEAGEGCPWGLGESHGLYAFHVPRSGAICGEIYGTCTEFFDGFGNQLLVAEFSPEPVAKTPALFEQGLIVTGTARQRIWSIPERRYLFEETPFLDLGEEDRVFVTDLIFRRARPAAVVEAWRGAEEEPDIALFFLDTRKFETVATRPRKMVKQNTPPLPFRAYERADIAPCENNSEWVRSAATREYLRQAFYEFDKHFRAVAGMVPPHIAATLEAPDEERGHRFSRIGLQLDAIADRLTRLLPSVRGPADSTQIAQLTSDLEFGIIREPDRDAHRVEYLLTALLTEMVEGEQREPGASEKIDAFLSSFGNLRYAVRQAEAAIPHGETRAAEAMLLREEASALVQNWRDGFGPMVEKAIFVETPAPLGDRLLRHFPAMCA